MFLCGKWGGAIFDDSLNFCLIVCVIMRSDFIFLIEFKLLPKGADHFIDGDVDYRLLDALW
jgi:hypothetical protein